MPQSPQRAGVMQSSASGDESRAEHRFGGKWTEAKLQAVSSYLHAYTTALASKFRLVYIDAFAGTGYVDGSARSTQEDGTGLLPSLGVEQSNLIEGSARRALQVVPRFDEYIFIDKKQEHCDSLHRLREDFPALGPRVSIRRDDANDGVQEICRRDWSRTRGVLFLDPYGMQVEWKTVEAVARTNAIDLWLLVPIGIGVNRLLSKTGETRTEWEGVMDRFWGTPEWRTELSRPVASASLFDDLPEERQKVSLERMGQVFHRRLGGVFSGVARNSASLRNSAGYPMYLLCFAVGNARGKDLALRIAKHILTNM